MVCPSAQAVRVKDISDTRYISLAEACCLSRPCLRFSTCARRRDVGEGLRAAIALAGMDIETTIVLMARAESVVSMQFLNFVYESGRNQKHLVDMKGKML